MQSDMPSMVIWSMELQIKDPWSKSKLQVEFQYGGRLLFQTESSYISGSLLDVRWSSEESDISKYVTESSTESPRPPSWKCIWRHYSAEGVPIWTKFGSLMQNSTAITVIGRSRNRKKNSSMADACFFSLGLRYVDEIWFADRLCSSEVKSDIITYETGTSIEPPLPPSWNCIWRHYSAAGVRFGRNLVAWCRIAPRLLWYGRSSNRKKFQYGGRLFFQTGSSYISVVNWDMSMKFGL